MAFGAFVAVAMTLWILSPSEATAGLTTTTTTGGTTGSPGYTVSWTSTDGECESRGAGPGYSVEYPTTGTGLNTSTRGVYIQSGGMEGPFVGWGEADCDEDGTFTATLTWNGGSNNLPPPGVLVVKEEVEAARSGDGGSVDCVMEGADYDGEGLYYEWCGGVRYHVIEDPGPTPDPISLSPSAYGIMDEESALLSAEAWLDYTITCYNVRVTYDGVLDATTANPKAMIGQAIEATVDLGGLSNSGATFNWEITGEGQFKSYTIGATTATLDTTFATNLQVVQVAFARKNESTKAKFWCNVNLATPNLDEFTVKGNDVYIAEPESPTFTVTAGTVDFDPVVTTFFEAMGVSYTVPDTSEYGARGATGDPGILWKAFVDLDDPFMTVDAGKSTPDRARVCYFNTISKVYRRRQLNNNSWTNCPDNFSWTPPDCKLDKHWPVQTISSASGFFVEGQEQAEVDGPGFDMNSNYKACDMDDDHIVYLMFKPFDNGVARYFVPLASCTWNPHGTGSRSASTWSAGGSNSVSKGTVSSYPAHPEWSDVLTPDPWYP